MTDTTIRKNTKAAIACLKKKEAGIEIICTCGSNTRLKIQIETRKIERGIAVMPHLFFSLCSCLIYRDRFLVMSLDG